jgi:hypothetical protein
VTLVKIAGLEFEMVNTPGDDLLSVDAMEEHDARRGKQVAQHFFYSPIYNNVPPAYSRR